MFNAQRNRAARAIVLGAFALINAACLVKEASAVAFINDPVQGVAFRPILWNVPTVNGLRTLDYAFAPADVPLRVLPLPNPPRKSLAFQPAQEGLVNQAVASWNNPAPQNSNVTQNAAGAPDLRTWATHELGHALGLGDPNRPGTIRGRTNFSPDRDPNQAGAQVNPFAAFAVVDGTTLRQSQVFADRASAAGAPYNLAPPPTEAAMIQLLRAGENKHALAFDDVHGLQALQTGPDFRVDPQNDPTPDDFRYVLNPAAYAADDAAGNPGQEITLFNANLRGRNIAATLPLIDRQLFPQAAVFFALDENLNVLSETDIFFTIRMLSVADEFYGLLDPLAESPELVRLAAGTEILEIGHVDIYFNAVPEPGHLFAVALAILLFLRARRRAQEKARAR